MAKRKEDIENPMILNQVIQLRQPSTSEPKRQIGLRCTWEGCRDPIYKMDGYLIIDGMTFCSDTCAAEHYMKDAGGHRVYGGAC